MILLEAPTHHPFLSFHRRARIRFGLRSAILSREFVKKSSTPDLQQALASVRVFRRFAVASSSKLWKVSRLLTERAL